AASFVVEKPEADLLDQKPRDPKARFMDKTMISSIVTSSLGLFAAVTLVYLFTWYHTESVVASQTVAFFSWMIGHVLLAFNMRSERQPIYQLGLGSNWMMIIWGAAVTLFLAGFSLLSGAQDLMNTISLTISQWSMILIVTFLGTFWLEIKKMMTYKNIKIRGITTQKKQV
ncbi:MAG: cation-translocating P-type ATPase C-terminal domain-containing protein, partial [Anaerolineaceae bacterium]